MAGTVGEEAFEVKALPPSMALAAPPAMPDEREERLCCGLTHAPDVRLQLSSANYLSEVAAV